MAEEDKTTLTSLEYWFNIIDLDNNGIITYLKYKLVAICYKEKLKKGIWNEGILRGIKTKTRVFEPRIGLFRGYSLPNVKNH